LCFVPAPLLPTAPTLLVADTFGLGGALVATPAPWAVGFPGVPAILDVTLQAAMIADLQGSVVASNALVLRVQPLPPPRISSVTPPFAAAGAPVSIQGADFLTNIELRVHGIPTPITSWSATTINFVMPAGVPCDAQLSLANPGTASRTAPINASPVITTVPFTSGPAAGGALFVVGGSNLTGCTVTIGGAPLIVTGQNAQSIVGLTPPGTPGPATVVVSNSISCQASTGYTYL
jgi:hypothetical protein